MKFQAVPIGDVVSNCSTWSPRKCGTGSFSYIDLSSVDKERKSIEQIEHHACSEAPSRARQLVEEGDVLVSTVRPNLNGVAAVRPEHDGMTASTGFCVLRPKPDELSSSYLFHWVKTPEFVGRMVDVATGANYPAVSDAKVKSSLMPVPPLPEQKRIAEILDAADALRAKRRESLAQLDAFLQSTFLHMFGDPVTNPMGWESHEIASFCRTGSGGTPSRKEMSRYYEDGSIPWVKSGELRETVITSTGECITDEALRETNVKLVPKGSLLIAMYGATVGRLGLLGVDATTNQAVCHIIPDAKQASVRFLFQSLASQVANVINRGVGGAQPNISQGIVKSFQVPLPPIELQEQYALIVEALDNQKARLSCHLTELDALFASLQARAFNGNL